jgi:extracellular factor (EF) 3-hydroxypalmitic acid methyl ester biosynthesis protein
VSPPSFSGPCGPTCAPVTKAPYPAASPSTTVHEPPGPEIRPWEEFLDRLLARGGPERSDAAAFQGWWQTLADACRFGAVSPLELQLLLGRGGRATGSLATMQGFMRVKPHGYAGDFELLDRIYQSWHSPEPALRNWDRFFHAQPAVRAIRSAKDYFGRWLRRAEAERRRTGPRIHLLHLGGGPGRELLEYFIRAPASRVSCISMDPDLQAVAYATRVCAPVKDRVSFWPVNPLACGGTVSPDLIWIGGLFDYLDDGNFVTLLRRLWLLLAPGGELVASNFSPEHPSRAYLELNGWTMILRDATHLAALALQAGIPIPALRIGREAEGVILFLHARRSAIV